MFSTEINFSHECEKNLFCQNTKISTVNSWEKVLLKIISIKGTIILPWICYERSKNVIHLKSGAGEALLLSIRYSPTGVWLTGKVCDSCSNPAGTVNEQILSSIMTSPGSVTWVKSLAGGFGKSRINSNHDWQANTLATIKLKRELIVPHAQQQI